MKQALAFLGNSAPLDYGRRLSRLRWTSAFPQDPAGDLSPEACAAAELGRSESWLVVADETALPLPVSEFPTPSAGRVLVAASIDAARVPAHTLRELESLVGSVPAGVASPSPQEPFAAFAFRAPDLPARPEETVAEFLRRLLAGGLEKEVSPAFRVLTFGDPSAFERQEITRHVPAGCRRLLDVGCGAGGSSAALRRRMPGLAVTGIERDAKEAAKAREALDRVLVGDAAAELAALVRERARFDAFLFADVLEHLEDPVGALSKARELAAAGAVLVASVPNAGHLSLVRDLVLGRFDPVTAGLADAGHLRWFTRTSLEEMLEESGWRISAVEAVSGAPAPETENFLARLSGWPALDARSLTTYQWVAVAVAGP